MMERTKRLVEAEVRTLAVALEPYRKALAGKKAAIYVGGSFKAFSLVKAFRLIDMQVVMVGSQTGTKEDYEELAAITDPGTIIVDDSNPLELTSFLTDKEVDMSLSAGSRNGPLPTSSASASATTTMSARRRWPVLRACSISPARSTPR
jgi:nitrogenase molybdenum-iron protein alpha/beta subunit